MNRPLRKHFTLFIILTSWFTLLLSQQPASKDFIKSVEEADIAYLYEKDYERAAGIFENLLKTNPGNANLQSKLGLCYLNIEEKKQEALKLLKQASVNIASDEEYLFYGEKASRDTYLNLALAYHMNDSLEKAISSYEAVRKTLGKFDAPQAEYIDVQISACRYAIEARKKPVTVVPDYFAPWLKKYPGACNPVLAKNDSVFIFTQKTAGKTRILCSYKTKGQWNPPSDITKQLGGYDRFYSNSISGNGKLLVLYLDDGGDGNLYFCQRKDTTWTKIKGPGRPINTIYWESHGFITPDEDAIYISSNRPGGLGELDIWRSAKQADGSWGEPVNLGEVINTPENEDTPFYDQDHNELIYSSNGLGGMGGYDVFRSTWKDGTWTAPAGMPYAFNTTTDNKFFILNNKSSMVVASRVDEKTHIRNIYGLNGINPADEITVAEGKITLSDKMPFYPNKAFVKLADINKKAQVKDLMVNDDATFRVEVKPGDYKLFIGHAGYMADTVSLNVPLYFLSHHMDIRLSLIPEKRSDLSFDTFRNILFEFNSYQLDNQARSELESIKSLLSSCPGLKFEVAGYADAKGSLSYNLQLADKRAQAVIEYLVSGRVPSSQLVKKVFGESDFAAANANKDGSDNPEGRKYNRRVTFGLIDPATGIVIRQDTYAPVSLRRAPPEHYSIVLKKSAGKLSPGYFDNLNLNGMMFIRTYLSGSELLYTIGVFYSRQDAEKYLAVARENGLPDAYIINHTDLVR